MTVDRVKQLNEIEFEWKFTNVALPTTAAAGGTTGNSVNAKKEDAMASAGANNTAVLGTA